MIDIVEKWESKVPYLIGITREELGTKQSYIQQIFVKVMLFTRIIWAA